MKDLNPKEERFKEEYLISLSPYDAAIESGYSESMAKTKAFSWVSESKCPPHKRHLFNAIQEAKLKRSEEKKIDADFVLEKAAQYLETSIFDFLVIPEAGSKDDPYFDFSKATEKQLSVIDGVEISQGQYGTKIKVSLPKKREMLDLVGRHVDVNAFKATDDNNVPIDQNWKIEIVHTTKDAKTHPSSKA